MAKSKYQTDNELLSQSTQYRYHCPVLSRRWPVGFLSGYIASFDTGRWDSLALSRLPRLSFYTITSNKFESTLHLRVLSATTHCSTEKNAALWRLKQGFICRQGNIEIETVRHDGEMSVLVVATAAESAVMTSTSLTLFVALLSPFCKRRSTSAGFNLMTAN